MLVLVDLANVKKRHSQLMTLMAMDLIRSEGSKQIIFDSLIKVFLRPKFVLS